MHIFQNLKTYGKPTNKDRLNEEPKKEAESWFDAFKGCLFAVVLFVGSIALLYGIGSAINSSEIGKDVLLIVGGVFVLGLVFYLSTPIFLIVWAFLSEGRVNRYLKVIITLILTIIIVGFVLYTCGSIGGGDTDIYEPGKLRPDRF